MPEWLSSMGAQYLHLFLCRFQALKSIQMIQRLTIKGFQVLKKFTYNFTNAKRKHSNLTYTKRKSIPEEPYYLLNCKFTLQSCLNKRKFPLFPFRCFSIDGAGTKFDRGSGHGLRDRPRCGQGKNQRKYLSRNYNLTAILNQKS